MGFCIEAFPLPSPFEYNLPHTQTHQQKGLEARSLLYVLRPLYKLLTLSGVQTEKPFLNTVICTKNNYCKL